MCLDGKSYLLSSKDPGSDKKTAKYCADNALADIQAIKTNFNKDVFGVCTDNEAKMLSMRKIINEENPKILTYGCSAHYLNLLEQGVTSTAAIEHIKQVKKKNSGLNFNLLILCFVFIFTGPKIFPQPPPTKGPFGRKGRKNTTASKRY